MMQLKEIRKELGITQKQLAEELSVSIPQISRYETGETAMTPKTIIKLCNYLGVTADQLLGHKPIPLYPIYRDQSWIHEGDVAPDILNSALVQIHGHLNFLEQELGELHTMIESSQKQLDLLLKTEQKISSEFQTISSYYKNLTDLFSGFQEIQTALSSNPHFETESKKRK